MREIIFRGKRIDNGEWVYGYCLPLSNKKGETISFAIVKNAEIYGCGWCPEGWEIDQLTMGQYTGLTDKNGKKIFEGDIVKTYSICDEEEGTGIVHWSELFVAWHYANNKCMYGDNIASYEIIGNIHDNKLEDFQNGC